MLELIFLFVAGLFQEFMMLMCIVNPQEEIAVLPTFDSGYLLK